MSIGTDAGEVLIPTVSDDGRVLSEEQAIDQYRRTDRHLGVFDTPDAATAYAQSLHVDQARRYGVAGASPMLIPDAEPDRIDAESPHYRASQGLALREVFEEAKLTDRLLGFIQADAERGFNSDLRTVFGEEAAPLLTPQQANERFGVPGRLSFDAPVDPSIAAWRQGQAQRSAFRDEVVASADLEWWQTFGAGFAGSVLDPIGAPLWIVPEFGAGRLAGQVFRAPALAGAGAITRGAVRGGFEGLAGGVGYEAVNLWLHHEARDDYDFGQASFNVIAGGVLGTGLGGAGGWWEGRGRTPRAPAAVDALDDEARLGAFVEAMEAMVEDRPVDISPVLEASSRRSVPAPARGPEIEYPDGSRSVGRAVDQTGPPGRPAAMTPERWQTLSADEQLEHFARDRRDLLADFIARAGALTPADFRRVGTEEWAPEEFGVASRSEIERRLIEDRAELKALDARLERGDLRSDPTLAAVGDIFAHRKRVEQARSEALTALPGPGDANPADPSTARRLTDSLTAWFRAPGGAPGPVAASGSDAGPGAAARRPEPAPAQAPSGAPEPADRGPSSYPWHPSYGTAEHWADFRRTRTNLAAPARYKALYGVSPPKTAKGEPPPAPVGEPFADPEVAALAADTDAAMARYGLSPDDLTSASEDPQTLADAIAAGAFCLKAA